MGTTISAAIELGRMDTLAYRVGKPLADLLPSTGHDVDPEARRETVGNLRED
jgi:hypothetical protein